jgi:hypothetical protein
MLDSISKKRKTKLETMTEEEKKTHYESKRQYAKDRRDKNIASSQREKFEKMDESSQGKFLDKLIRYGKLIEEFNSEISSHDES